MDTIAQELPMMIRYARFLCRYDDETYDMADDVAAVAMERALVNRMKLKADIELSRQMRGFVKYAFLSRKTRGDDAKKAKEEFEEQYEVARPEVTADPTDKVFVAQMIERINKLERDLRNPMLMFVYGFSFDEIAESLKSDPEIVAELIYRARKEIGVIEPGALSELFVKDKLKSRYAA